MQKTSTTHAVKATKRDDMYSPSKTTVNFLHQFARACTALPGIAGVMIAN